MVSKLRLLIDCLPELIRHLAVNTGVGASANTRTKELKKLQQAVIRTLNNGIIEDDEPNSQDFPKMFPPNRSEATTLPQDWVKAGNLVRCNSLAWGNSGIRLELLESIMAMIREDVTPQVPLRGSISASGDLSPLSYLAGALQGNPGVKVWVGDKVSRRLVTADVGMAQAGVPLIKFGPKEAVALMNGTSVSAGAAAIVMQDAHHCVVLAQILTAMTVEALNGTNESFDPYLSDVRPHPGQREVSSNIFEFLKGSELARGLDSQNTNGLRQDRYALRTSPQWMGPEIENLMLAQHQILIECNSITDNPLIKPEGSIIQGGNFQATAITSAMDRTRLALHTIGRMLFQQTTELMNPATNNGLPPNLTSDEPSCDFLMKGMDISSASYMSELSFLAQSVMPSVMVAEQGNQSLNSLALVSTRYTSMALGIFMCLAANQLVALCQALDLRAVQMEFERELEPVFKKKSSAWLRTWILEDGQQVMETNGLWNEFVAEYGLHSELDHLPRLQKVMQNLLASSISRVPTNKSVFQAKFPLDARKWIDETVAEALIIFNQKMNSQHPSVTIPLLGSGGVKLYQFLRYDLQIPFLRNALSDPDSFPRFEELPDGTTLGTFTSRVFQALKNGSAMVPVMSCLGDSLNAKKNFQKSSL